MSDKDKQQKQAKDKMPNNAKNYNHFYNPAQPARIQPNAFYPLGDNNAQSSDKNKKSNYYSDYYNMYGYGYPTSYMMPPGMPNIMNSTPNYQNDHKFSSTSAAANSSTTPIAPNMYPMMNSVNRGYPFSYPYYGNYQAMNPYYGMYNPYYYSQLEGIYSESNPNANHEYKNSHVTSLPSKNNQFTPANEPKQPPFKMPANSNSVGVSVAQNNNHLIQQAHQPSKATQVIVLSDSENNIKQELPKVSYNIKKVVANDQNSYQNALKQNGERNSSIQKVLMQQSNHDPFYIKKKRIVKQNANKQKKKQKKLREQTQRLNQITKKLVDSKDQKNKQINNYFQRHKFDLNFQKIRNTTYQSFLDNKNNKFAQKLNKSPAKSKYMYEHLKSSIEKDQFKRGIMKNYSSKQLKNKEYLLEFPEKGEERVKNQKNNDFLQQNGSNDELNKLIHERINRFNNRSFKKQLVTQENKSKQFLENQIYKFNFQHQNYKFKMNQSANKKRNQGHKRDIQKQKMSQNSKGGQMKAESRKQERRDDKKEKEKQEKKQGDRGATLTAEQKQQAKKQKMKDNHPLKQLRFIQSHGKIRIGCYFQASLPNLLTDDRTLLLRKQLKQSLNQRLISAITF